MVQKTVVLLGVLLAFFFKGSLLLAIPPLEAWEKVAQQVAKKWRPWIVQISCERPEKFSQKSLKKPPFSSLPFAFPPSYFQRPRTPVTGILISKQEVITSFYNVLGAKKIQVTLSSGNTYAAKLMGGDLELDIALLKIEPLSPKEKVSFPFPTSSLPKEGSFVFLLGQSCRLSQVSISPGIISRIEKEEILFQVDCRANYTNTGGALVDLSGRFLGMVCQIQSDRLASPMGQNSGVTLCLPWDTLRSLLPLFRKGQFLYAPLTPPLGAIFAPSSSKYKGLKIKEVIPQTAASQAGLQKGDILLQIGYQKTLVYGQLYQFLRKIRGRKTVPLLIQRKGKVIQILITLYGRQYPP